jgi:hypothetical protein
VRERERDRRERERERERERTNSDTSYTIPALPFSVLYIPISVPYPLSLLDKIIGTVLFWCVL